MYSIIVKFDLEGYHRWPNAPLQYKLLRSKHSHNFRFEAEIEVNHSDRALEILDVRRTLHNWILGEFGERVGYPDTALLKFEPYVCNFRTMSCELLAELLSKTIRELYYIDPLRVVVMEDEFVGATYRPSVWTKEEQDALAAAIRYPL